MLSYASVSTDLQNGVTVFLSATLIGVAMLIVGIVGGIFFVNARKRKEKSSQDLVVRLDAVDRSAEHLDAPLVASVYTSALKFTEVDTVLVPVSDLDFPDVYLALGPTKELVALAEVGTWSAAGNSVVMSNLVAQSIQGYSEAATLVRLSPDTVNLIKSGAEVVKAPGGFNLGVLRDPGTGRFVGQVKWAKAGSAVSTVAALGNAVAMAMIQMQLNAISDKITHLTKSVDRLSASFRFAVDGDLRASVRAIDDVRQQAEISGMVTDRQLRAVQGESRHLDAHIRRLESECNASLRRLNSVNSQKQRLDWLGDDGIPVAKAMSELAMASRAWATSRALEAANMLSPEYNHDAVLAANRAAAEVLIEQTRERMRELDRLMSELGYQFARALDLVELTTGKVTLKEKVAGKVTPTELQKDRVKELAAALRNQLASIGIDIAGVPPLRSVQEIGAKRGEDDSSWRRVIALLLNPDETVQVILHGRGVGGHHNMSDAYSAIVVTDQRILAFRKLALQRESALQLNESVSHMTQLQSKTAYGVSQLRITLREAPRGLIGAIHVDLGMTPEEAQAAIEALSSIRDGQTDFAPQGPDFDEIVRRLDGGPRGETVAGETATAVAIEPNRPIDMRNRGF